MSVLKIISSGFVGVLVATTTIVGSSNISAVRAEAPTQQIKIVQTYTVPASATVVKLDRSSYSATTVEEVEAKRLEREAAEKAAAEEAARQQQATLEAQQAQEAAAKKQSWVPPRVTPDPGSAQAIAHDMVIARGWTEDDFSCLVALWNRESGWRVNAHNASSGAYGIPQSLPGNKMASAGADWETNPATQITWGLNYIGGRYGSPCGAWDHSESHNWY